MEYFTEFGYIGLFFASFLAATILPLSSEVILSFLLLNNLNPTILVSVATFGNVLGSFVNYSIGVWGSIFFVRKFLKISEDEFVKAKQRFQKYGVFSLFFAWVPVIGDPLTVVAGVLKINLLIFFIMITSGKLIRYVVISYAIL
ncbi:MAG: DedA family protein [Deltaproteobacteria bacterium]|nr:DedA family protein [Deltaproteobacteria bacterium]MBW2564317.1 DedA family protein [Deltaproteobacteria bacterium]